MKMTIARIGVTALAILGSALLLGARPADRAPGKADPKKEAPHACSACREKKPLVDPASLGPENEDALPAYEAAWKYPETVDGIRCFCGCAENPRTHHLTLLTCFTSAHATGCEICQKEATMAGKMKEEGSTDAEIKGVVEDLFGPQK